MTGRTTNHHEGQEVRVTFSDGGHLFGFIRNQLAADQLPGGVADFYWFVAGPKGGGMYLHESAFEVVQ